MQDDGADKARTETAASFQFVALSLRDGLDGERVYHSSFGLDRSNSSFWQRCRAIFSESGLHHITAYNILQDVRRSLTKRPDPETLLRERFLRALRTGQIDAIGYLPPRLTESVPVLIPSDAWDQCQIGWEIGELKAGGFHFLDVRILMSVHVFDRHDLYYLHQPVTALAPFALSDEKRRRLGIPASSMPEIAQCLTEPTEASDAAKIGRTTRNDEILAAYNAIEKNPHWKNKELVGAIRDQIMRTSDRVDDDGLGHNTILKHVGDMWRGFKRNPPAS